MATDKEHAHDLYDFMRQLQDEMATEYYRIEKRAREDPGTAGDQGEENWAELLRGWLPSTYTVVTKGRLISEDGRTSPQLDVIVLKDIYPKKLESKKLYLAAGVAAAFECKITLRASHIAEAVQTCVKVKDLFSSRVGTPYKELHAPIVYGLLAHSHSWRNERSTPEKKITEKLIQSDLEYVTHPRQALDLLCVADCGVWASNKITFLGPAQLDYQRAPFLAAQFGQEGSAGTMYMEHVASDVSQAGCFTPIGSAIECLTRRLAWENPALRALADYYRNADIAGQGGGNRRPWPGSIYSDEVRQRVEAGHLVGGSWWEEWGGFFW